MSTAGLVSSGTSVHLWHAGDDGLYLAGTGTRRPWKGVNINSLSAPTVFDLGQSFALAHNYADNGLLPSSEYRLDSYLLTRKDSGNLNI